MCMSATPPGWNSKKIMYARSRTKTVRIVLVRGEKSAGGS